MVISKFICIPLLILVPLIILIFESRQKNFSVPPSDEKLAQHVEEWRSKRPALKLEDTESSAQKTELDEEKYDPEDSTWMSEFDDYAAEATPAVNDALKGIDLDISPGLNHLQGMKAGRLKGVIRQVDPDLYPELAYLANERLLDSAPDSSVEDRHFAGEYLSKNGRPLWNPEASMRVPLKVHLNVETFHFEKAKALSSKIETDIFYGSGGTVEATVIVKEVGKAENSISLEGKKSTALLPVYSIPETEKMIVNAIQLAVTNTIREKQLSILHTDKIHYTYYTRLTWLMLAEAL